MPASATVSRGCCGVDLGFQLALDIAAIRRDRPDAIGTIRAGTGSRPGVTPRTRVKRTPSRSSGWPRRTSRNMAERSLFGPGVDGREPLPADARRERAAALLPLIRGLASTDRRQVGHYTDTRSSLDFLARESMPRLAALGTSCPDHFLRTKVRPLVVEVAANAPLEDIEARLREAHAAYRDDYRAYYDRHATPDSPPMRGADPAIVLVPGVGMFSFGADKQTARVAGEFYVNAINVMRGAEALSTYAPIPEAEKFRIEYWPLEEAKLARLPKPKPLATRIAFVTGGGSGIGRAIAHRLAAEGACVVVVDIDAESAETVAREVGGSDVAIGLACDVTDQSQVATAFRDATLAFGGVDLVVNNAGLSISKSLFETTVGDGISSTMSWHAAPSWSRARRRGSCATRGWAGISSTSSARTPSSPGRTTLRTGRRKPIRHTRSASLLPSSVSSGSGSTA